LVFAESSVKGSPITGDSAKSAALKYKNLSPEEQEVGHYCQTSNPTLLTISAL